MQPSRPRRQFFRMLLYHTMLLIGAGLAACRGRGEITDQVSDNPATGDCHDFSGVSEQNLKIRENFGYLPKSPVAENRCNNCNLWIPNETDASCGRCLLFKGPVSADGYCTSWAPQM